MLLPYQFSVFISNNTSLASCIVILYIDIIVYIGINIILNNSYGIVDNIYTVTGI